MAITMIVSFQATYIIVVLYVQIFVQLHWHLPEIMF